MVRHKSKLLQFAAFFASRKGAVIMALIGMIVQAWHTFSITSHLSMLEGWQKIAQALFMAVFLSGALLYFTLKSSDEMTDQAEKYRKMVVRFAFLESCINLWYWGYKLVFLAWPNPDWVSMVIAVPFSFLLPIILKAYGGEIRIDEPEAEFTESEVETMKDHILNWVKEQNLQLVSAENTTIDIDYDTIIKKVQSSVSTTAITDEQYNDLLTKVMNEVTTREPIDEESIIEKISERIISPVETVFDKPKDLLMQFSDQGQTKTLPIKLSINPDAILTEKMEKVV